MSTCGRTTARAAPCACSLGCGESSQLHAPDRASAAAAAEPCLPTAVDSCQGWYANDFDDAWDFGVWTSNCFVHSARFTATKLANCLAPCRLANASAAFLLGDSHAASYAAGFAASAAAGGRDARHAFAGYGCSFASPGFNAAVTAALGSAWVLDDCDAWVAASLDVLRAELRPGDVVATTTANWKYDVAGHVDVDFVAELGALAAARGAAAVVLGDAPLLYGMFGVNCASAATRHDCDVDEADAAPPGMAAAEAAWAGLGDVAFFRAFDLFCAGGVCGAQIPGTDVLGVVDYGHLTTAGSLYVAPFLTCFLEARNLSAAVAADRDSCPSSITDT